MNKILSLALIAIMAAVSCQKEPQVVNVTAVTLDMTSLEMTEGESQSITATVSPQNADNKKLIWTSSDASVATVSGGTVTAIKAGTATITATSDDGGKTATCRITVKAKVINVTGVSLNKIGITMTEGDTDTISATVAPDNATNKSVSWTSSDTSVATVTDGKVTAVKAGSATITVKTEDGGKTATCEVTVIADVAGVSLNKTTLTLSEGENETLEATISPSNATNKNVTWSSSNTSVATVSDGKVTAVKAGSATITVKTEDGGKTATCEVTVIAKVSDVSLNKSSMTLTEGESETLTATITPSNATNKNVTWSSSNTSVATVSDGKVTAVKAGSATITVKTEDGGKTATCSVQVKARIDYRGFAYVDLGLPSGLKWATKNIGASNPEDYGNYYAWGEVETKSTYNENNYNYSNYSEKYYMKSNQNISLDLEDDVAHMKWGGSWRMPTSDEAQELIDNCTWSIEERNGVTGFKVVGPNGNSLFMPCSGYYSGSTLYAATGSILVGDYWLSSMYYNDWYTIAPMSIRMEIGVLTNYPIYISAAGNMTYYGKTVRAVSK